MTCFHDIHARAIDRFTHRNTETPKRIISHGKTRQGLNPDAHTYKERQTREGQREINREKERHSQHSKPSTRSRDENKTKQGTHSFTTPSRLLEFTQCFFLVLGGPSIPLTVKRENNRQRGMEPTTNQKLRRVMKPGGAERNSGPKPPTQQTGICNMDIFDRNCTVGCYDSVGSFHTGSREKDKLSFKGRNNNNNKNTRFLLQHVTVVPRKEILRS